MGQSQGETPPEGTVAEGHKGVCAPRDSRGSSKRSRIGEQHGETLGTTNASTEGPRSNILRLIQQTEACLKMEFRTTKTRAEQKDQEAGHIQGEKEREIHSRRN